eukprot:1161843-Pelagomonas_calceolata.AAC.2
MLAQSLSPRWAEFHQKVGKLSASAKLPRQLIEGPSQLSPCNSSSSSESQCNAQGSLPPAIFKKKDTTIRMELPTTSLGLFFLPTCLASEKKKNYAGSGNLPKPNQGEGDTLAQESRKFCPPIRQDPETEKKYRPSGTTLHLPSMLCWPGTGRLSLTIILHCCAACHLSAQIMILLSAAHFRMTRAMVSIWGSGTLLRNMASRSFKQSLGSLPAMIACACITDMHITERAANYLTLLIARCQEREQTMEPRATPGLMLSIFLLEKLIQRVGQSQKHPWHPFMPMNTMQTVTLSEFDLYPYHKNGTALRSVLLGLVTTYQ